MNRQGKQRAAIYVSHLACLVLTIAETVLQYAEGVDTQTTDAHALANHGRVLDGLGKD